MDRAGAALIKDARLVLPDGGTRLLSRLKSTLRRTWRRVRARSVVNDPAYRGWAFAQAAEEARAAENRTLTLDLYGRAIDSYLEEGQSGAAEIICQRLIAVEPRVVRTRCTLALLAIGHDDVETACARVEEYFSAVVRSQSPRSAIPSLLEMAAATANPVVRCAIASAVREAGEPLLADAIESGRAAPAETTSWSHAVAGALKRPDEVNSEELRGGVPPAAEPPDPAPADAPRSNGPGAAGEQKIVLIVDDDENARDIQGTMLREAGYRVIEGTDGAHGLLLARRHRPDLIILDLQMPKLDGWQTLEALRADPAMRDTTVLALTIVGEGEDRRDPVEFGFDAHYVKPVSPKKLVGIVQNWIGGAIRGGEGSGPLV